MNIEVTEKAVDWFQGELDIAKGDSVQFFVRYGGCGDFQSGFSLGVTVKTPEDVGVGVERAGIYFYIENKDIWYFDESDLFVDYDETIGEIKYIKQ